MICSFSINVCKHLTNMVTVLRMSKLNAETVGAAYYDNLAYL